MRHLNKKIWPFRTTISERTADADSPSVVTWLEENIGQERKMWYHTSFRSYYFKTEVNLLLFLLRWK